MQLGKAMILAAGLGKRMGGLSDHTPKPMVKVNGIPLIDRLLAHGRRAGIKDFVVNVHHLADKLETHLAADIEAGAVHISDEREALLETGGGVKKALPLLGDTPFLAMNGDALWVDAGDANISRLAEAWDDKKMDVLLLLVPTPEALGYDGVGDFFVQSGGAQPLAFRDDAPSAPYMFGGVQILKPVLYEGTPEGAFSNRLVYRKAVSEGRLWGLPIEGHWMHVGTPEAIGDAEARLREIGAK